MKVMETEAVTNKQVSQGILAFMLIFATLYFFLAHEGLYYSDDIGYSAFAGRLLNGNFDIEQGGHTFIHRPAVFVPTAVFYWLLGINHYTYSLWPYLCTLGCIIITFRAAHQKDLNPSFAVVFIGFTFYFIYFITFLYPDNIVAFFTLLSAGVYCKIYSGNRSNLLLKAIIFTCSLFLAGLAKETAVIVLPFFCFFAIKSIFQRNDMARFWTYAICMGTLLLLLYFYWYYLQTGNAFYRVSEMETANLAYDNYVTNPSRSYLKRLLWAPVKALVGTGTFIIVVFMVGGKALLPKQDRIRKSYWSLLFFTAYIVLCFSSTSLKIYNPIKLDARMYNLVIPPLVIAASYGFQDKLTKLRYTLAYTLVFGLIAVYLHNKVGAVYAILALYFAAHSLGLYLREHSGVILSYSALAVIALSLSIRPLYFMLKPKTLIFREHEDLFVFLKQGVKGGNQVQVILPQYLFNSASFYLGYENVEGLYIYSYSNAEKADPGIRRVVLVNHRLNTHPSFTENSTGKPLLNRAQAEASLWKSGPLELYEL